jgi:hypothetical protein
MEWKGYVGGAFGLSCGLGMAWMVLSGFMAQVYSYGGVLLMYLVL